MEGLAKTQTSGSYPKVSDSVRLRIRISNKLLLVPGAYFDLILRAIFQTEQLLFHQLLSLEAQRFGCSDPLCPVGSLPFFPHSVS